MRAVIQKVVNASVSVDGSLISSVGRGLCVLVGICRDDTSKDVDYIIRKILNLRLFDDDAGKRWSKNVMDRKFEILCVSQFTLHAVLKGNKLDFHQSMAAEQSQEFYQQFLEKLRKTYRPDLIKDGQFGAYMSVNINNDGPVTITLDSRSKDSDDGNGVSGKMKHRSAANGFAAAEDVKGSGVSAPKSTEEKEKNRQIEVTESRQRTMQQNDDSTLGT